MSDEARNQAAKYAKEVEELRPRIQQLTKQSRELQTDLAKEISLKYDNRPVYITGGLWWNGSTVIKIHYFLLEVGLAIIATNLQ